MPGSELNPCARALFDWQVDGHGAMPGAWRGWRVQGRFLIAPDRTRIAVERLALLIEMERLCPQGGVAAAAPNASEPANAGAALDAA